MAKALKAKKSDKPERTKDKFVFRGSKDRFGSARLVSDKRSMSSGEIEPIESAVRAKPAALKKSDIPGERRGVLNYASVLDNAVETFGSRFNANAWLYRPNRVFANKTPLQILTEDPEAIEEELVRIDHGMFT